MLAAIAFGIAAPFLHETWELIAFALLGILFGVCARLGKLLLFALLAAAIGWLTYSGLSYIWHRDSGRFVHFAREQFLRAVPLFVTGMALITTTTVVQFEAALRALRVPLFLRVPVETMLSVGPRLETMWKERLAAANIVF
jgi:energy-coupling factor transporter transmembrane protein EcfT